MSIFQIICGISSGRKGIRMKLKNFIFYITSVCAVLPVLFLSAFFIYTEWHRERVMVFDNLAIVSKFYSKNMDEIFGFIRSGLEQTYSMPMVQSFLQSNAEGHPETLEQKKAVSRLFRLRTSASRLVLAISLIDAHGTILACSDEGRTGQQTGLPEVVFSRLRHKKSYFISNILFNRTVSDKPLFIMAIPVSRSFENGEASFRGAILYYLSVESLREMINNAAFINDLKSGSVVIIDSGSRVVTASSTSPLKYGDSLPTSLLDGLSGNGGKIDFMDNGVAKTGYYSAISDTKWKIVTYIGEKELLAPVYRMLYWNLLYMLALLVLASASSAFIVRKLTDPVFSLLTAMRGLRNGDLNARFDYQGRDEFGEMAENYNILVGEIKAYMDREKNRCDYFMERSMHDSLTGLLNKGAAQEVITAVLDSSSAEETHLFFIMDIDKFKNINDSFGHETGDRVITAVASKLRALCRSEDVAARIGGDEFVILMRNIKGREAMEKAAERVRGAFSEAGLLVPEVSFRITGSIGCCLWSEDGKTFEELYKAADKALYRSKNEGRDRWTFYS